MKTENIKAIFTNLLFVIGVILLIVGFITSTNTAVKSLVFDEYPLNSWEETRCDETNLPYFYESQIEETANQNEKQEKTEILRKQQAICATGLTQQRKRKQVEDIVGSITMLISGAVLVFTFKSFIFERKK